MSFDFNPNINLSNVQASSKSTPGGGGNTGYFRRDGEEEESGFRFKDDDKSDTFEKNEIKIETTEESFADLIKSFFRALIAKIKSILKIK